MQPVVNVMVKAARAGGNVLVRHMHRLESVNVVDKARMDYASDVDRMAEEAIVRELRRAYPDYAVIGEEGGVQGSGRNTWVIDPLDGTSNYLHGIGHWCVSIALLEGGEATHGVIFDPLRNELFTASKGAGTVADDKRMRVGERKDLPGALLATGFHPRVRAHVAPQLAAVQALLEGGAEDIRRTGSAALDLAYVACGRLDGYFEAGVQPWDIAAGVLMVREAGGRVGDFRGGPIRLLDIPVGGGQVMAGNLKLFDPLQRTLAGAGLVRSFGG